MPEYLQVHLTQEDFNAMEIDYLERLMDSIDSTAEGVVFASINVATFFAPVEVKL